MDNMEMSSESTPSSIGKLSSSEKVNQNGTNTNSTASSRFPREVIQILRSWLSANVRHPYPNDEDKEKLARQTGLSKAQISTWMANARRKGNVRASRSEGYPIHRKETSVLREMNPMERWEHSPPEHEPVPIDIIEKAISASSIAISARGHPAGSGHVDDGSTRSIGHGSSAGSMGTSRSSNGSSGSAFSHTSRVSLGSFGSFGSARKRGRHRRRLPGSRANGMPHMRPVVHKFQCTFCTETFKTKHDWQRHEKSLHLSIEQWVCSPEGPSQTCPKQGCLACAYCGLKEPPPEHADQHVYSLCVNRPLAERTFYRKDHIRQHLSHFHDVKFQSWSMDGWRTAAPEIRSRCGFCGHIMESWGERIEHLADHFKGGKSMVDWTGDWGFEEEVLRSVENALPPYLIHFERLSPNPYEASKEEGGHDKISQNYEELGNSDLILDHHSAGLIDPPTVQHGQIHLDASQSEVHSWIQLPNVTGTATSDSFKQQQVPFIAHTPDKFWNQDPVNHQSSLEMLSDPNNSLLSKELTQQSPFGTDNLSFIQALNSGEIGSLDPSQVLHWNLTGNDAPQLGAYPENSACLTPQGQPTSGADSIRPSRYFITDANCYRRLEKELTRFVLSSLSPNNPGQHIPTDEELQNQARWIIYDDDDPWNQTAADNAEWLARFKRDVGLAPADEGPGMPPVGPPRAWRLEDGGSGFHPPYLKPKDGKLIEFTADVPVAVDDRIYNVSRETAEQFARALCEGQYRPPASVFCSRDLEDGLRLYVEECIGNLHYPTDDELRMKAQEILGTTATAADDPNLLEKFKAAYLFGYPQMDNDDGLKLVDQSAHDIYNSARSAVNLEASEMGIASDIEPWRLTHNGV
ncbi:hypothetical protein ACSS6W_001693 [Trichoderma asperelloides]